MIRVIIADDHQLFRLGLVSLIDEIEGIKVIDQATDGEELVKKFLAQKPDVALVDISMPKLTGYDAFKEVIKFVPQAKFFFLSMFSTPEYIHYTRKLGGKGLLGKNVDKDELGVGIKAIMNGEDYYGKEWTSDKLNELDIHYSNFSDLVIDPDLCLTVKEKEVLYYLSDGYSYSEMADKLKVSKRTVESHRYNIAKKVGANSSAQLIAFAIKFASISEKKMLEGN